MRPPRTYLVTRLLFEAYFAVLLGTVILAILIPPVVSAREAAARAVCTNNVSSHSGSHADIVCLEQGRIVWVSRCWCRSTLPGCQICFVEEKDGELQSSEKSLLEGLAVLSEALDRLRQHKLNRRESGIPEIDLRDGYRSGCGSHSVPASVTPRL
jgi:hypothetical protein